jgi:hypothetical protein
MGFMGSGFNAINIGDEIIELNNQVVVCCIKRISIDHFFSFFC